MREGGSYVVEKGSKKKTKVAGTEPHKDGHKARPAPTREPPRPAPVAEVTTTADRPSGRKRKE